MAISPPSPEVDSFTAWVPAPRQDTRETQYDEVPAVLANHAWVLPGRSTRERALLDLAAAVLGQGKLSRLYLDLIYELQLASQVAVSVVPYELASLLDMAITLNPGVEAAVATAAMDRLVAAFIESGPSSRELERVVTSLNAGIIRGLEQVGGFGGKAVTLAEGALYADDPLFIAQYLEWINGATPEDVRMAASTWLTRGSHQVDVVPARQYQASSSGIDRSAGLPAIPGATPSLRFPDIRSARLSNGMEVAVAERRTIPFVEFALEFNAGYAADAGSTLGLASFTMQMLETGTVGRDALDIAEAEERLGAQIAARSSLDASSVTLSALRSELQASVELWADLIRNPQFSQAEIERLRGRWMADIAQEKAQPRSLALRLLPAALCGEGHAYAVPLTGSGTEASIESITRDDLLLQEVLVAPGQRAPVYRGRHFTGGDYPGS
ncbi:insulinase family protein [Congregibacter sp.]|uniref:insulinase family protein n=1 Tax=Congregibacter sp. TaxID=2744308 RepID=UPI0039E67DCE